MISSRVECVHRCGRCAGICRSTPRPHDDSHHQELNADGDIADFSVPDGQREASNRVAVHSDRGQTTAGKVSEQL